MRRTLLEILVDPTHHTPLELRDSTSDPEGRIESGELCSTSGQVFPVLRGIPRFTADLEDGKAQVSASFGYKWHQRSSFDTDHFLNLFRDWAMERYGFAHDHDTRHSC